MAEPRTAAPMAAMGRGFDLTVLPTDEAAPLAESGVLSVI